MKGSLKFKTFWWLALLLPVLGLLCCGGPCLVSAPKEIEEIEKSGTPPTTLGELDLVGTWEADNYNYCSQCVDRLILRADGTFRQIYRDFKTGYVYETPWHKWRIERFPDGRIYVHLEGARWYVEGTEWAEENGMAFGKPWGYHDPFDPQGRFRTVEMIGELVLNVRLLRSGKIILVHMWSSSESPSWQAFYRVESLRETQVP